MRVDSSSPSRWKILTTAEPVEDCPRTKWRQEFDYRYRVNLSTEALDLSRP